MAALTAATLKFTVHRQPAVRVAPAVRTPRQLKRLSDIDDQEGLRFQVPIVLFYRRNACMEGRHPARVIRDAVAKPLVHYYPLAGRLTELEGRKLAVDCNEKGMLFVEADAGLEQFGDALHPPFPCFEELFFDVPGSSAIINSPLLLIQDNVSAVMPMVPPTITEGTSTKVTTTSAEAMAKQPSQVADEIEQTLIVPELGMAFESEDDAYDMYNTYAEKVPRVVKGAKHKRTIISLEKRKGKKMKSSTKKGLAAEEVPNNAAEKGGECDGRDQLIGLHAGTFGANITKPNFVNGVYGQSSMASAPLIQGGYASTVGASYMPGGYTGLLLGVDQDATLQSAVRKLHFDGVPNHENL
ncbi:hypothetical protein EJB05_48276, partial [Eragrostis curvula]